jgi:hypothetical protein
MVAFQAGCDRPNAKTKPPQTSDKTTTSVADASLIATVDLQRLDVEQVRTHLGETPADKTPEQVAESIKTAVTDLLVLREMAVLELHARPGEPRRVAAERLLTGTWSPQKVCRGLTERELKQAYFADMARYRHPDSTSIWEAQWVCCHAPDDCPAERSRRCKSALKHPAQALHDRLLRDLPKGSGLASEVTRVSMQDSPLPASHGRPFEAAVTELASAVTQVQLKRYRFFVQGDPRFAGARFPATDPEVESTARDTGLGRLTGVVETVWGWSTALVVASEAARNSTFEMAKTEVQERLCRRRSIDARRAVRQRLFKTARVLWHDGNITDAFGKETLSALPPDARKRDAPHVPRL